MEQIRTLSFVSILAPLILGLGPAVPPLLHDLRVWIVALARSIVPIMIGNEDEVWARFNGAMRQMPHIDLFSRLPLLFGRHERTESDHF